MKSGIVVCVLVVGVACSEAKGFNDIGTQTDAKFDSNLDDIWTQFKKTHKKYYKSNEEMKRRTIWEDFVKKVQRHNLEYDLGLHTFTMGINEYSDLTRTEYKKYLLGARPPKVRTHKPTEVFHRTWKDLPETVDWRTKGLVTPIKNQGQCGSCWAFATVGSLEGQHAKRTGNLVSLSEQNLVDCVHVNAGCGGGWMDPAFKYVETNGGIDTENSYPYEAEDQQCQFNPQGVGATDYGYADIPAQDEIALKAASAEVGPITVAIDAALPSFQSYRSGVYYEPKCTNNTDHAVLVIGYGTEAGQDYWLVKNSWGTSWGINGYIKMSRNKDNNCGIASYASFPFE